MRPRGRGFRRINPFWLMAAPAIVLFFVFSTLPALEGVLYSFTDYTGFGTADFVGLQNYIDLFSDEGVRESYLFTIGFAILTAFLINALSLALAVGLAANIRFRGFLRSVFFLPAVLSTIVIGYVFNFLFSQVLPELGQEWGIEALSKSILGDAHFAWIGLVIVAVWQGAATTTVIYLGGITSVPGDLLEASRLDGANGWQQFWHVTFPLLAPFLTVNLILSLKNQLMVFDLVVALTGGGPGTSTRSISYLIYRNGFGGGEFGYQSANAVVYFLVIAAFSFTQLRLLRRREVSA